MDNSDKILISKSCINKIKFGLKDIKMNEKSKILKKQITEMLSMLENELSYDDLSLEDRILKKMKETKSSDPEMNANLYILYRNLTNGRITQRQALELFNMYSKIEPYQKTIE